MPGLGPCTGRDHQMANKQVTEILENANEIHRNAHDLARRFHDPEQRERILMELRHDLQDALKAVEVLEAVHA